MNVDLSFDHRIVDGADAARFLDTLAKYSVRNPYCRRRPDETEIVTEMDRWTAQVAYELMKWLSAHRPRRAKLWENNVNSLLVLAGQDYIEPLCERGVFEYGIARMSGDPNEGYKQPLRVRYLFEEIDAGGIGEQMGLLSDVIEHLQPLVTGRKQTEQTELGDIDVEWGS